VKIGPLVSVVIVTYNRSIFLVRAAQSVLCQTYKNLELIIIDDASSDDTESAVKSLNNDRVQYFRNEITLKAQGSRNRGIKESKGDYIAFLDDDDEWIYNKLEKQMPLFKQSELTGFVYCGSNYVINETGQVLKRIIPTYKGDVRDEILKTNILSSCTPVIKKSLFEKASIFDENLLSSQDWDMWIRLADYTKFDFVSEPLANYYLHGNQVSYNSDCKMKSFEYLLKKYHVKFIKNRAAKSKLIKRIAILKFLHKDYVGAVKGLFTSFAAKPSFSGLVHLKLSFFPPLYKFFLDRFIATEVNGKKIYY